MFKYLNRNEAETDRIKSKLQLNRGDTVVSIVHFELHESRTKSAFDLICETLQYEIQEYSLE